MMEGAFPSFLMKAIMRGLLGFGSESLPWAAFAESSNTFHLL